MVRKTILTLCILILAVTVSAACKKKDEAAPGADPQTGCEIFGTCGDGDSSGDDGDYLDKPVCGDKTCNDDLGETPENCPADCAVTPPKSNASNAKLDVNVDGDMDNLKQLDTIYIEVEMDNFSGAVGYSFVEDVAGIVDIDIEKEDDEKNEITYKVIGATPGEVKLTFTAVDVEDSEKVFTKDITITVIENIVENNSEVSGNELLVADQDLIVTLKSKYGSEPDLVWNQTKIYMVADDGSETEATSAQYTMVSFKVSEEDKTITETYKFITVGVFNVVTSISDSKFGHTTSKTHKITITEDVAVDLFIHTLATGETEELTAAPPEGEIPMEFGHQEIVVAVTGYDDAYGCANLGNLVGEEDATVVLTFTVLEIPETIKGKMVFCKLSLDLEKTKENIDLIGKDGIHVKGVKLIVTGDYAGERAINRDVKIVLNQSDIELKIKVYSVAKDPDSESDLDIADYLADSIELIDDGFDPTDIEMHDVPLFSEFEVVFEVEGGVPPYTWSLVSDVPDMIDVSGATIPSSAENKTWEKVSRPNIAPGTMDATEIKTQIKNKHYYQVSGEFAYSGELPVKKLDPMEDPYEKWTLEVKDSTGKKRNQAFSFAIKWPELKNVPISSLNIQLSVTDVTDTDMYSWFHVKIMGGSAAIGLADYWLYDCGDYEDDENCEDIREIQHKNSDGNWTTSGKSSKMLSDITEILLDLQDPNGCGWSDTCMIDFDLQNMKIWNSYYWTFFNEQAYNELNDNESSQTHASIRRMLKQLGFDMNDLVHHIWQRSPTPTKATY